MDGFAKKCLASITIGILEEINNFSHKINLKKKNAPLGTRYTNPSRDQWENNQELLLETKLLDYKEST